MGKWLFFTVLTCFFVEVSAQSTTAFFNADGTEVTGTWQSDGRLKSLVLDLHPAVYVNDGAVKVREKSPTVLYSDLESVKTINGLSFPSGKIEIVTILVDDLGSLSQVVDLSVFAGFERLKYVHVKASVECQTSDLFQMLKNVDSRYQILVTVERPS
ncbi:MAG: hypothetical protein K9J06_04285 [Flavobacteriales bacterium]|nr:hypothetical protein [Flavobacteriales bacterium]